jgi:hypothetical protein
MAGGQGGGLSNLEVSLPFVRAWFYKERGLMVVRCDGRNHGLLRNNRSSGYKLLSS